MGGSPCVIKHRDLEIIVKIIQSYLTVSVGCSLRRCNWQANSLISIVSDWYFLNNYECDVIKDLSHVFVCVTVNAIKTQLKEFVFPCASLSFLPNSSQLGCILTILSSLTIVVMHWKREPKSQYISLVVVAAAAESHYSSLTVSKRTAGLGFV